MNKDNKPPQTLFGKEPTVREYQCYHRGYFDGKQHAQEYTFPLVVLGYAVGIATGAFLYVFLHKIL